MVLIDRVEMNKFLIFIGCVGLCALGVVAVQISNFARSGELKVHLRAELIEARKEVHLLPLRSERLLGDMCRAKALQMAETKDGQPGGSLDTIHGPHFVELGLMPKGTNYLRASPEFLSAARNPSFEVAGFGQHEAHEGVYYCYILAPSAALVP